ncbi:MAG: AAA family ATPase [Pyrinomonadaceae bacterium]
MFLNIDQLKESLQNLESIHPFYGTTFLTCKRADLPIGRNIRFPISVEETKFLDEFYRPDESSTYFYRVFRTSDKRKHWVERKKYASSTLQAIRTQTLFKDAFIHKSGSDRWGWEEDYVEVLKAGLSQNYPPYRDATIPAFDLAVWLFRDYDWVKGSETKDLVDFFLTTFKITREEEDVFDLSIPTHLYPHILFQREPVTWDELRKVIGLPPDSKPEEEGTLTYLELQGIGPARKLIFEPAERLSLIAGDNGLGKSFLLECAWWALTGQWAGLPAYPREDAKKSEPKIIFQISGEGGDEEKTSITYDWDAWGIDKWPTPAKRPTIPGLLVYARVDGSFAICDPVGRRHEAGKSKNAMPRSFVFTRDQVRDGFEEVVGGQKRPRINGLLRDWVSWQNNPENHPFEIFEKVLSRLSPPSNSDLGALKPGTPTRLPDDSREIPTLEHSYGTVPIVHAAAGVQRIITLAYLLVWTWNEHKINSKEARREPSKRMVVLIDELEAHLHPQWQRRILPALLGVGEDLSYDLQIQLIIATHSPLVMVSAEPTFDSEVDKLFHLDLNDDESPRREVKIEEIDFIDRGLVDFWLTSEVFELKHARSLEAEKAIEEAKALQQQESPSKEEIQRVSNDLQKYLAEMDIFWPRWVSFAERYGVHL